MTELTFVTGSPQKFRTAHHFMKQHDIKLVQNDLETIEIQSETGEPIAKHKANEAYKQLQRPIVVTDDSWIIPALGGFPGPYMKSMNHWLSAEKWLELTKNLTDRTIVLQQIIVYQDELEQVVFTENIKGTLLHEARGTSDHASQSIISMDGGKHSIAEVLAKEPTAIKHQSAWTEFIAWLEARNS